MLTGRELVDEIDACDVPTGNGAFWWLGQHSFVVKLGSTVIYVDPFLRPMSGRRVPPLLLPADVRHADLILGTHDHADHIDREVWPALAEASPKATFVVPELLLRRGLAGELSLPPARFVGLTDGQVVELGGVTITGVASAHEFLDRDETTGLYPYLGFVVRANGVSFYHAGDSCVYEGLQTKLLALKPDAVFLPINGRDAQRLEAGVIGNMTYQEAADLAGAIRPRLTVPAHFDMFAGNLADPQVFARYMAVKYPALRTHVPLHGRLEWF